MTGFDFAGRMSRSAPVAWLCAYAVIVWSNAADIATDRYGLPPIGMATLLVLAWLLAVRTWRGQEDLSSATRLAPAAAVYLLVAGLSLFWVQDVGVTADRVSTLAKNLLIGLVFVAYVTSMDRLRLVAIAIALTLALVAALGVFQYVTQTFERSYLGLATASIKQIVGSTDSWRISGPLGDANFFGQILIVGLPMTACLAVASRQPALKLLAGAGCAAILAAIVLTFSRGTLFAVVVVAAAFVMTLRRRLAYAGVIALGLAVALAATPTLYLERLLQVGQAASAVLTGEQWIEDPALAQRLSVLSAAFEMFRAHPLLGIGLGQFPVEYGDYALRAGLDPGAPNKAHSVYLGTLAEEGLVGLALLTGTIGAAWVTCTAARRRLQAAGRTADALHLLGLQLGFLGYLTTALFLHNDYARYFWILVALLLSTASASRRPSDAAAPTPLRSGERA